MAFDEQLTRAFETLTERLRGEIDQEVERRTAEIAAMTSASAEAAAATLAAAREAAPPEPPRGVDDGASVRLSEAFRSIDAARSLTGVLDALLDAARAESPDAEVWLRRGGRLHHWPTEETDSVAGVEPRPGDGVPLTIAGEAVGVVIARRTTNDEPDTTNAERRTSNVELLTRYAARSLEALTAFKTARALTQRPEPAPVPAGVDPEDDISARRYARLLVSEIKLYHEPAVVEGRRDRDLATRLGGEIARARAMYEQRVSPHVRERADYFHDELVRTLCNGDSSLLDVRT